MKNKILPLFLGASLLLGGALSLSISNNKEIKNVHAYEDMSLSDGGDAFRLMDKEFSNEESFVYTGELYFSEGQAGGLVFGGVENEHYYVINLDRYENHIKLMEFTFEQGEKHVDTLYSDDFIGNNKNVKSQEWSFINSRVRNISNVNMKVVVTVEDEHAYAEFFVEGIKRFGIDTTIDLNEDGNYVGGKLGLNCFNSSVTLRQIEAGKSDYSYFSEPYRNQYHLQPYAKWTNDPNALCYYNGWYHVFYQTNPFGLLWDAMFWGHARSRDLIHFEYLPICLFPSNNDDGTTSYMWSGCAVSYYQGMSDTIDSRNWFPNGNGNGLFAIFTEDRCGDHPSAAQNQIVITSDDEGLTWEKRDIISQREKTGLDYKIDWRDPKIFPVEKDNTGKVTTWGMSLSSYALNKGWLLKSSDLLNWNVESTFMLPTPECIGIGVLQDEQEHEHAYLTNKSRTYLLGSIKLVNGNLQFLDDQGVNIQNYSLEEMNQKLKPLDFGPDSYASQSFYITDDSSEYCGKDIVLNWFSGDLNAPYCTGPGEYANLRGRWNGGFTTPVEYGLKTTSDGLKITQKPITVDNVNLAKTNLVNITNQEINSQSENPLKDVHTHIFEMEASITTNNNSPITFKVDVGENEYMQFGWNTTDGYYVDRTYLDDKGINTNVDWHVRYSSHILGDSSTKTFYVLSDNGGLEVFCEDYSIPFYFVTTAAISSTGASLVAENATINSLKLNDVLSAYQKEVAEGEGVLYVACNEVMLDTELCTSKFITCSYSGKALLTWTELENYGAVEARTSNQGINLRALKAGTASYKVQADDKEEIIRITVSNASFDSDFTFKKENIVSGNWNIVSNKLIGEKLSGNAFILANESGTDFEFTGQFDINSGTAGALVFRAASDMSSYLVANYDANEKVVKLWSTHGELTRSEVIEVSLTNITLTVKASGKLIDIAINGQNAINYTLNDNEPLSGRFGLNVYSSNVTFKKLSLSKENYEYTSGELEVDLQVNQYVKAVYNLTNGNTKLEPGYYRQTSDTLYIKEEYFALLENGLYRFKIVGAYSVISISVNVNMTHELIIDDVNTELGLNVNVYIGNTVINSISVNDQELDASKYVVEDYVLSIDASCFDVGDNLVVINHTTSFHVNVKNNVKPVGPKAKSGCGGNIVTTSVVLSTLSIVLAGLLISKRRRGLYENSNY